ncbi:sensor domain-containing diguanylate cyclase [Paenibacillus baekrokdamisoli]|uniref:Sensor domain-containing diguanylate cyclase n=1 Tax=Paenibacillus baekrokdamisoli TaxID=1712516 RepID=A0A3G9IXV1_9BACL|nr:sensor domain-containing diguanylate cyclase [Paenibacillus baekrokdamisoli]MBB3068873.1 diguanylate cyclase (GGDEF)-like protein [Paenibacillus baekrokdamisoli]BBH23700.1 sensor domain-containing diguanylate cyclase [Paenibacillus baekrokdamisoli]
MKRRKGFTLRFMVSFLVVLSVLLTLTLSALVGYRNEKQSLFSMTLQLNQTYSNRIADTVNEVFLSMRESLEVTGEYLSKDLSRPDLDQQLDLFRRSHSNFTGSLIVDKTGYVLSTSPNTLDLKGKKLTTVGAQQALRERKPLISEPYIGTTKALIIMVSQPLFDSNNQYLGYIGGTMRLHGSNLMNTLLGNSTDRKNGSYAYVVSSTGVLLYHPEEKRIGEKVLQNPIVRKVVAGESGAMRVINTRGVDMLASYTYIKEAGWGIVAQTPTNVVLASSRDLALRMALYTLPVLLIFLVFIYGVIGRLSAPLVVLANYAAVLSPHQSQLDEIPRINSWNAEANALHKAFGMAVNHFRNQFDHLSMVAQTDPLTGLFNRRTMGLYMEDWISKKMPFVILVLDLDKFKKVNDTYGHELGDEVLKFLAQSMRTHFEKDHVCCRYGGEEFVILLPAAELDTAARYAETIRAVMAETDSPIGKPVTLSIGIAAYPGSALVADQLFRMADEALYRAKRLGRNRVEHAELHDSLTL